jgi:hypothetical protein
VKTDEEIWEGAIIMTPFGRAVVRKLDLVRQVVHTDLGSWNDEEIFRREAPEDPGHGPSEAHAKAMQAWLEGPAYEARGVVDIEQRPCHGTGMDACCHLTVHIHKRSRAIVQTKHVALGEGGSCRCLGSGSCECWPMRTS